VWHASLTNCVFCEMFNNFELGSGGISLLQSMELLTVEPCSMNISHRNGRNKLLIVLWRYKNHNGHNISNKQIDYADAHIHGMWTEKRSLRIKIPPGVQLCHTINAGTAGLFQITLGGNWSSLREEILES
jgi:hypothetical protein